MLHCRGEKAGWTAISPKIIYQILAGLKQMMIDKSPGAPKFLDRDEYCFRKLMYTCNSVYRDLHSQGIGTDVCHTPTFSSDNEKLWETGVLGDSTPKSSQQAVFFLCCKIFLYPWWRGAKKAGSFYGQNTQIATPMLKTALRTEVGEWCNNEWRTSVSHAMRFQKRFGNAWHFC